MESFELGDITKELVSALEGRFRELSLVLFGSYARGDFVEESDIDFLVACNRRDVKRVESDVYDITFELTVKAGKFAQVIVMDYEKLEEMLNLGNPLAFEIVYDGKILLDSRGRFAMLRENWLRKLRRETFKIEGHRVAQYKVLKG